MNIYTADSIRTIPVDTLIRRVEREFLSGRLGITESAEVYPLVNLYDQTDHTHFRFADTEADRLSRQTCPHCQTAFRSADQRDPARCPFCWRLI